MHITRLADAPSYTPSKHVDVDAFRLQGVETSGVEFCSVGLSYYEPGGRAEMDAGPQEKLYVVLEGELAIELADGDIQVLSRYDSCRLFANERREVRNESGSKAVMLVITPPPVGGAPPQSAEPKTSSR
jgi:quercetin dioxygenase-like cupin family protein